jgi:hypothetical protein
MPEAAADLEDRFALIRNRLEHATPHQPLRIEGSAKRLIDVDVRGVGLVPVFHRKGGLRPVDRGLG